jgi:hypothetical protein
MSGLRARLRLTLLPLLPLLPPAQPSLPLPPAQPSLLLALLPPAQPSLPLPPAQPSLLLALLLPAQPSLLMALLLLPLALKQKSGRRLAPLELRAAASVSPLLLLQMRKAGLSAPKGYL